MKAPLQTVPEDAYVYRAIGRMDRLGFRHLGVTDGTGEIVGAVTTRNLLRPSRHHRHRAGRQDRQRLPRRAELAAAWASLPLMARNLMQEEVDPRTISGVVSSEICSMTRRAAELAEERLRSEGAGPPPVAYAVLVLGSAGRKESQLAADQDNAIVYAEGAEGGPEDAYFEKLATHMNDILDAGGIPYCKGGVMAKNRAWRKSAADWYATIDAWVRRQRAGRPPQRRHLLRRRAGARRGRRSARRSGTTPMPRTLGARLSEPSDRGHAQPRPAHSRCSAASGSTAGEGSTSSGQV